MAKAFAKVFAAALKHLPWPWASPWPQGPQCELEVFAMAKGFRDVFAMAPRPSVGA